MSNTLTLKKIKFFNIIWIINNLIFFLLFDYNKEYAYSSLVIRIISTLLCIMPLILLQKSTYRRLSFIITNFNIYLSLPFFFSYMLIISELSMHWLMNCISALFFTMILIPPKESIKWIFLSLFIAIAINYETLPTDLFSNVDFKNIKSLILTFISPIVIGYLFIHDKHKEEQETLSSINKSWLNSNLNSVDKIIKVENVKKAFLKNVCSNDMLHFNTLLKEINHIFDELEGSNVDKNKQVKIVMKLKKIIKQLCHGLNYLKELAEKTEEFKLYLKEVNIEKLLSTIKEDLALQYNTDKFNLNVPFKELKIKLDEKLMQQVIILLVTKAVRHGLSIICDVKKSPLVLKYFDTKGEYAELTIDGIRICIKYVYPSGQEEKNSNISLNNTELDNCKEIIKTSYGVFNYNKNLDEFEIILPKNVDEIRPKAMNDFTTTWETINATKSVLNEWQESVMKNIQQNLRKKGFDNKGIIEITGYPITKDTSN